MSEAGRTDLGEARRRALAVGLGVCALALAVAWRGGAAWAWALSAWALAAVVALGYEAFASRRGRQARAEEAKPPFGDDDQSAWRMLEQLPDPILVIDRSGRVVGANAEAREQFGIARVRMLLSSVMREPAVLEAVNEVLHGAAPQSVEFMSLAPRERHVSAFVAPIARDDGGARAMVALHDQTAAKRAERTRVDFLANASHQLRTPLASLAGYIETLRGHARHDAEARDRFLEIMQTQSERMRRLIDDLLSLSRIELNEHVPPTGVADLVAIAGDVVDAAGPIARDRGVMIELTAQAKRAPVLGDRDELIQVVQNLVDNAVKYCGEQGRVRVTIACGTDRNHAGGAPPSSAESLAVVTPPDVLSGLFASLEVADNGPGIERRHLPRIAERFYRANERAELTGTGLGLAIVKHIVSRHRGGFIVGSERGVGSSFAIFIPHTLEFAAETTEGAEISAAAGESDDAVTKV